MKLKIILMLYLIFGTSLFAKSQVINLSAPQGTYYLTDKEGKDYKLVLLPKSERLSTSSYYSGKAELTRMGENEETFYGQWRSFVSDSNDCLDIQMSEDSDLVLYPGHYNPVQLITGTGREYVINKNGWMYFDHLQKNVENPKYRVKIGKSQVR